MAIEEKTIPYEILIRLGPDGYQAAHVIDLEMLVDTTTGAVRAATELPARPISVAEAGEILGTESVALLVQIDLLKADLAAEKAKVEQAEAARAEAESAAARAEADKSAAVAEAVRQVENLRAEIAAAMTAEDAA